MPEEHDNSRFSQWQMDVLGKNMLTVLNAMGQIVRDGDWNGLGLLTMAGNNVEGLAKRLSVSTPNGKVSFEEFRQDAIRRLQNRLVGNTANVQSLNQRPRLFISYNHNDRERANALAVEFSKADANVFLDHWDMAPSEEILPRIEKELHGSDVVIALLSQHSSNSQWVKRELEIGSTKAGGGRLRAAPPRIVGRLRNSRAD